VAAIVEIVLLVGKVGSYGEGSSEEDREWGAIVIIVRHCASGEGDDVQALGFGSR
jgi:hypothetical protein